MKGCFVTGTDTGVGKTLAAAALLHALQRHHRRVVGMKPVAVGAMRIAGELTNEDAVALRGASTMWVAPELDNSVLLPQALSPHIAAQRAGKRIDIKNSDAGISVWQIEPISSSFRARAAFTCR